MIFLKRKGGKTLTLHSQSLLALIVDERLLAVAAWDCVCGPRNQMARGWCTAIYLENKCISCKNDLEKGKEGRLSPVLMVAGSRDCGGWVIGGVGWGLLLWAEISN